MKFFKNSSYPLFHGWQIVNINNNGPTCHHQQQILEHRVLVTVPESIAEPQVILDSDWIDGSVDFEAALLEHHHRRVVNASAFRKDENRLVGLFFDVFAHSPCNKT